MALLIVGLAVFLAPHSVAMLAPDWRAKQIARLRTGPYKLAYSAVSIAGVLLIVWGFGSARGSPVVLWTAPPGMRHVTAALTVVAFILVVAAYYPRTRIKATLGHPMTAGVALWALGHLLSNGRLADVVLFGAFLVWSVALFAVHRARDRRAGVTYAHGAAARDAVAIAIGILAALAFAFLLHGPLIGVRPFG